MTKKDLMRNAFYAMAVADAVGNEFEFKQGVDPASVVQYAQTAPHLEITDDTQMALFTAQAIDDYIRLNQSTPESFDDCCKCAYYDWYITQTRYFNPNIYTSDDGLLQFESLYKVQAPGLTCMRACEQIGHNEPVHNDSMGCGAVMRLLPFAGLFNLQHDATQLAVISGLTTHQHEKVKPSIERYIEAMGRAAFGYPIDKVHYPIVFQADHISQLGEGWIAPEAVNMAIWAAGTAKDFDELLAISIAHDGDSDSVGAMAGALWGLMGKDVPIKYVWKIVEKDAIEHVLTYKYLR